MPELARRKKAPPTPKQAAFWQGVMRPADRRLEQELADRRRAVEQGATLDKWIELRCRGAIIRPFDEYAMSAYSLSTNELEQEIVGYVCSAAARGAPELLATLREWSAWLTRDRHGRRRRRGAAPRTVWDALERLVRRRDLERRHLVTPVLPHERPRRGGGPAGRLLRVVGYAPGPRMRAWLSQRAFFGTPPSEPHPRKVNCDPTLVVIRTLELDHTSTVQSTPARTRAPSAPASAGWPAATTQQARLALRAGAFSRAELAALLKAAPPYELRRAIRRQLKLENILSLERFLRRQALPGLLAKPTERPSAAAGEKGVRDRGLALANAGEAIGTLPETQRAARGEAIGGVDAFESRPPRSNPLGGAPIAFSDGSPAELNNRAGPYRPGAEFFRALEDLLGEREKADDG